MSRFVECKNGVLINTDAISRVVQGLKKYDDCTVFLMDDTYFEAPYYVFDEIRGSDQIVQVIPVDGKYVCIYSAVDDENPCDQEIDYLALCANGQIRALDHIGDYLDFADNCDNYVGYRPKDSVEARKQKESQVVKTLERMSDGDLLKLWQQWEGD